MNNEEIINSDFNIWCEANVVDFEKGKDGKEFDPDKMYLAGIASTEDVDTDGQILKSNGLELDYLLSTGMINWHHAYKTMPSAIIGEPIEAKIVTSPKLGLFIKAKLYDTEIARDAYSLAAVLQKQSKTRRLGWSIEGKILERTGDLIHKARLTGIALTPSPKNSSTFAELCKAFTTGETTEKLLGKNYNDNSKRITINTNAGKFDIQNGELVFTEKALTAEGSGVPLMREDLEGSPKNVNMSLVLKAVLQKYPLSTFEQALKISKQIVKNRK